MIFVTVGTDQPFDRMLRVIDSWAREKNRRDVFAQIGANAWQPGFIESVEFLEPGEFKQRFNEASLIISHAGMGTILSALHGGKPILVMPKRASLGEHRNEHQLATARKMMHMGNVTVAFDEAELRGKLQQLDSMVPHEKISPYASGTLIHGLRNFIFSVKPEINR
jgi:UDP-N-acetylglucosamine transferase subunit ALG13